MRIAVINEVSAREKGTYIMEALTSMGMEAYAVGMSPNGNEPPLTYIHTGLMAALSLHTGAADFVIGGCGTGQGFLMSAMQYPGVFCGLITDPLDAWLFSQINGGNCVSLALNKGFGWAGDVNVRYLLEKLFCDAPGQGYPPARSESQRESRGVLAGISAATHKQFTEIFRALDREVVYSVLRHTAFTAFIKQFASNGALSNMILKGSIAE